MFFTPTFQLFPTALSLFYNILIINNIYIVIVYNIYYLCVETVGNSWKRIFELQPFPTYFFCKCLIFIGCEVVGEVGAEMCG